MPGRGMNQCRNSSSEKTGARSNLFKYCKYTEVKPVKVLQVQRGQTYSKEVHSGQTLTSNLRSFVEVKLGKCSSVAVREGESSREDEQTSANGKDIQCVCVCVCVCE